MTDDPRRRLPGVDRLLASEPVRALVERHGRDRVMEHLREVLAEAREDAAAEGASEGGVPGADEPALWAARAEARLAAEERPSLRPVVNATGVLLHTNLGRAPLAPAAVAAMAAVATGYANLEFDLGSGRRGSRYDHSVDLLRRLTGAEAALVVNNCAAALVLAVATTAPGRSVVVSRGELVEIGGGFRIPDILERAGARLREVGTTNRTRAADYRGALAEEGAGAVLKVHRSNFRLEGFTAEATLEELREVADERGVPLIHDVGSGLLLDPGSLGLPPEPTPRASVAAGADVVVFSGDKLLGGPQAGLVVGRKAAVAAMRSNPLCRALRTDKVTLAGLEATLRLYLDPTTARREVPVLRMLLADPGDLEARARRLAAAAPAGLPVRVEPGRSAVGGGTLPGFELPSWTLRVGGGAGKGGHRRAERLRTGSPAVVGRVEEDEVVLDLRSVHPSEDGVLLEALARGAVDG